MLKVALIVGSDLTQFCGVKDYAERLAAELFRFEIDARVLAPSRWTVARFSRLRTSLLKEPFDIVHLQYPSIGYRASLLPHLLGPSVAPKKSIVTVHEFTALPRLQRLSVNLFRWTTDQTIFVSQFERDSWQRSCRRRDKSLVIPIASNIPVCTTRYERKPAVIYFGQIRPQKGIEDFLTLAHLSSAKSLPFHFVIAGSAPAKHQDYLQRLRLQSPVDLVWQLDLPASDVSTLLASSFAAYLPFPDGVSERRGSVLASMENGLPVISRLGPASGHLETLILTAETPAIALERLEELHRHPSQVEAIRLRALQFTRPLEWTRIATQHKHLYESLVEKHDEQTIGPGLKSRQSDSFDSMQTLEGIIPSPYSGVLE